MLCWEIILSNYNRFQTGREFTVFKFLLVYCFYAIICPLLTIVFVSSFSPSYFVRICQPLQNCLYTLPKRLWNLTVVACSFHFIYLFPAPVKWRECLISFDMGSDASVSIDFLADMVACCCCLVIFEVRAVSSIFVLVLNCFPVSARMRLFAILLRFPLLFHDFFFA